MGIPDVDDRVEENDSYDHDHFDTPTDILNLAVHSNREQVDGKNYKQYQANPDCPICFESKLPLYSLSRVAHLLQIVHINLKLEK